MQASFVLSFLAILCLSHQTFAIEKVEETVKLATGDVTKADNPPVPNRSSGGFTGCKCTGTKSKAPVTEAKEKVGLPVTEGSVAPQSEEVKTKEAESAK